MSESLRDTSKNIYGATTYHGSQEPSKRIFTDFFSVHRADDKTPSHI
jgi:hypothetical protein